MDAGNPALELRRVYLTRVALVLLALAASVIPPVAVQATEERAAWHAAQIAEHQGRLAVLVQEKAAIEALDGQTLTPPHALADAFPFAWDDLPAIARVAAHWTQAHRDALHLAAEKQAVHDLAARSLAPVVARAEERAARPPQRSAVSIPSDLSDAAKAARQRLLLLALDQQLAHAQAALLQAKLDYLARTAEFRNMAKQRQDETRARQGTAGAGARQTPETAAERLLAATRAQLEETALQQTVIQQTLGEAWAALHAEQERWQHFRTVVTQKVDLGSAAPSLSAGDADTLYDEIVTILAPLRPQAREDLWRLITYRLPAVPEPPPLDPQLDNLPLTYHEAARELARQHRNLNARAATLRQDQRALISERLEARQHEITWLNQRRTALIPALSERKRAQLLGFSPSAFPTAVAQYGRELQQFVVDTSYWLYQRLRQIDQVPSLIVDVLTIGHLLWRLIQLIALILLVRFVLTHWNRWLSHAVRQAGHLVTLGRPSAWLAKLLDGLRHAGPPLVILAAGMLVYHVVGAKTAAAEVRVAYIIFFWLCVYRAQLRVVEVVAKYIGADTALDAEMVEKGDEFAAVFQETQDATTTSVGDSENVVMLPSLGPPQSVLFVRSVRWATRYLLVVILTLALTEHAVGQGTIYGMTARFFWLPAIALIYFMLRLWRPHIAAAYAKLSPQSSFSALARIVQRSELRFYGVIVTGIAFVILLAHRLGVWIRRYIFSLDATKRGLALLFRRQVAREAQALGRIVTTRQALPDPFLAHFPIGGLQPADHPLRTPALDDIVAAFHAWKDTQADGSVALVGHAGMGKSTLLSMLASELEGSTVLRGALKTKITRPAKVVAWLSEVFGFSPKPTSEKELVRMIREDPRPVIALDHCHNLFLRHVSGFAAWHAFIRIVNQTADTVFWVLGFNQLAWNYLYHVSHRIPVFHRVVSLPGWSEQRIRRLLLSRMSRSGYRVSFSDLLVAQLQQANLSMQLGRTSQGYFRLLWDVTDGNPRLATHYWLHSLVPDEHGKRLRVHLFDEPNVKLLEALPDSIDFVLAAIAEHENLTAAQAARVTNLPEDVCAFAFGRCLEDGFLEPLKGTNRLRISKRWQQPLIAFLRRKHLIHGDREVKEI